MPDTHKQHVTPTILVVDDHEDVRRLVCMSLAKRGFQIREAANGAEACGVVARERIDLVVSDVRMPIMGGIELLAELKRRFPDLPVLLMSAEAGITTPEARGLGAMALFRKPVSIAALVGVIEQIHLH